MRSFLKIAVLPCSSFFFGYRMGCLSARRKALKVLRAVYLAMFHMVRTGKTLEEKKELCWSMFSALGNDIAALFGVD